MSMSRRSSKNKDDNPSNCPRCTKAVTDKEMGLECEICEMWFHIKCQGISEAECKFLGEHKSVHWYCITCNENVASVLKMYTTLEQRQDKIEEDFAKLRTEISEIASDAKQSSKKLKEISDGTLSDGLKKAINSQIERFANKIFQDITSLNGEVASIKAMNMATDTKLEMAIEAKLVDCVNKSPTWADAVARQVDNKFGAMTQDLDNVQKVLGETKKMAEEEKDKENRSCNIIIYRVEEKGSKDERRGQDKKFCLELFKEGLDVEVKDDEIKSLFRLGKFDQNAQGPRPLLVQFRDKSVKNHIMESLSNLRNADDKYKNLSISHDLTKTERDECKNLVEQAKKKQSEEQGEYLYRVRGPPGNMKVVRIRKQ